MRALYPPTSRGGGYERIYLKRNGDEIIDGAWEKEEEEVEKMVPASAIHFPASVTAGLKFGYEASMYSKLSSAGTNFNTWITAVMAHVQAYYHDSKLPTQINFKVTNIILL